MSSKKCNSYNVVVSNPSPGVAGSIHCSREACAQQGACCVLRPKLAVTHVVQRGHGLPEKSD